MTHDAARSDVRKKLIEVALPLEAINEQPGRINMHLWWARRPLAACRAVLFASLVDDPSSRPEKFPTEDDQHRERERLFRIIEDLVKWENLNDERVLEDARKEILESTDGNPPPVLDPFCGGGSIPLEAQRLGLTSYASDLNPVAVLITKALTEIPPKFAAHRPVNPESAQRLTHSPKSNAHGLAEDVRFYGKWMRDEAEKRIGHLYPKLALAEGDEATVVAWLWARAVKCPNPACGVLAPLIRSFFLSTRKNKEVWVSPYVDPQPKRVRFTVKTSATDMLDRSLVDRGAGHVNEQGKKSKAKFRCVACESATIDGGYVDREANAGRMSRVPLALVAETGRGRVYKAFDAEHRQLNAIVAAEEYARDPHVAAKFPDEPARGTFAGNAQGRAYGFKKFADYFTTRQLVALTTFSDLVGEARERVLGDANRIMANDGVRLAGGGTGADAYADAVATYLAFAVDRSADAWSTIASWRSSVGSARTTFARQALQMAWDYAEVNPFGGAAGDWSTAAVEWISKQFDVLRPVVAGEVSQRDARTLEFARRAIVSTDPPYYDNIGYADLSDFFYVWLRRCAKSLFPQLFSTLLVPKEQELIASPYRFDGDSDRARRFFESGMDEVFYRIRETQDPSYPATLFYAFKQAEESEDDAGHGQVSTGWEAMLEGLCRSGFQITATWPLRTEKKGRSVSVGANALASSVVLACRVRGDGASITTRREFIATLKTELPHALKQLQSSSIAAVDLAQAAIGPGMALFSRYAKVIEADGSPMRVRSALQLINQELEEVLSAQESEYDSETQWAVAWFSEYGMSEGPFGVADTLSRAKNTSVDGMQRAGIVVAAKGKVRLLSRDAIAVDWDPATDARLTVWEVTQHLLRRLQYGGELDCAELLRRVGGVGEVARDLAYRLYSICDRKGWSDEALALNALVVAWPEISRLASEAQPAAGQMSFS